MTDKTLVSKKKKKVARKASKKKVTKKKATKKKAKKKTAKKLTDQEITVLAARTKGFVEWVNIRAEAFNELISLAAKQLGLKAEVKMYLDIKDD